MANCYITNGIGQDGFGARMQRVLSLMCLEYYIKEKYDIDIKYIHAPFSYEWNTAYYDFDRGEGCESPYNERFGKGYRERVVLWDNAIKYKKETIHDLDMSLLNKKYSVSELISDIDNNDFNDTLYVLDNINREIASTIINRKKLYKHHDKLLDCFGFDKTDNKNKQIIIHIRRGHLENIILDDVYIKLLNQLPIIFPEHNILIHTQRLNFNSSLYKGFKIIYDDEYQDYDAFIDMVNANIFIMGNSSLSYSVGLLNRNDIYYITTNNEPIMCDKWKYIDSLYENNEFQEETIINKIYDESSIQPVAKRTSPTAPTENRVVGRKRARL